uniref:Uncharacterized protein n=1 Tax=Oryza brachyantha TaxID=4533 RepID=J3N1V9_ORYBR
MTRFRKEPMSGWSGCHVTWLDWSHDSWRSISVNDGVIVTTLREELRSGRSRMSGDDVEYEVCRGVVTVVNRSRRDIDDELMVLGRTDGKEREKRE